MATLEGKNTVLAHGLELASVCAAGLLHGALEVEAATDGWVRPHRFGVLQRRALASCLAWHPGLFRQMSVATCGVCLRFCTDANELALALRLDDEPQGTAALLQAVRPQASHDALDGVSAVVDGRPLGVFVPEAGGVRISLADPAQGPGNGIVALPGLGQEHEVVLWLPCLRGCELRELWCDGTYLRPVEQKGRLLVLGDAFGQGFCAGDPARSWPALVAGGLSLELVNQSVAGQVFQPSQVLDAAVSDVACVVVELGISYHGERADLQVVASDVRGFFSEVRRHWPDAQVLVVTPPWFSSEAAPVCEGSCFPQVATVVQAAAEWRSIPVVDGLVLMDHDVALLADGAELPNAAGHQQFADRLLAALRGEELAASPAPRRRRRRGNKEG